MLCVSTSHVRSTIIKFALRNEIFLSCCGCRKSFLFHFNEFYSPIIYTLYGKYKRKSRKNKMERWSVSIIRNRNCWKYLVKFRFYDSSGSWIKTCQWSSSSIPSIKRIVQVCRGVDALAAIVAWYLMFFGTRGSCVCSSLASRACILRWFLTDLYWIKRASKVRWNKKQSAVA